MVGMHLVVFPPKELLLGPMAMVVFRRFFLRISVSASIRIVVAILHPPCSPGRWICRALQCRAVQHRAAPCRAVQRMGLDMVLFGSGGE